ncbi:16S rRNA m(7)G-527 methyltransferase [Hasllibacter halocynthiae]|uniref:Ribosomal RNA small subunit methyltransferase G n=1 Tax=Hasllibacter halocynthiae TaxID=595589 RepID=A0A2T0X2P5_9RHOB|nr:16S rRNA (guanine(527)-N(7))-methyltransferase RsmG [Hasllibacter halocynthiae]PRY93124.1 16S rRNA m(7)G-527 methyltransferase [Hasllibacter halocynthiae]
MNVPRGTIQRYADLVHRWNPRIQLFAPSDLNAFETRHFADGLEPLTYVPGGAERHVDFGSGGGIPLVPMTIAMPGLHHVGVEADRRKAAFLNAVARELSLNVEIRAERLEDLAPQDADVVTARAFAPLVRTIPLLRRHLRVGGRAILQKGRRWREEVEEANDDLDAFELRDYPTATSGDGRILVLDRMR